jgi:hypothetical protein
MKGFIPSMQRYYRRYLLFIQFNCYMFRSYDHLQAEIWTNVLYEMVPFLCAETNMSQCALRDGAIFVMSDQYESVCSTRWCHFCDAWDQYEPMCSTRWCHFCDIWDQYEPMCSTRWYHFYVMSETNMSQCALRDGAIFEWCLRPIWTSVLYEMVPFLRDVWDQYESVCSTRWCHFCDVWDQYEPMCSTRWYHFYVMSETNMNQCALRDGAIFMWYLRPIWTNVLYEMVPFLCDVWDQCESVCSTRWCHFYVISETNMSQSALRDGAIFMCCMTPIWTDVLYEMVPFLWDIWDQYESMCSPCCMRWCRTSLWSHPGVPRSARWDEM